MMPARCRSAAPEYCRDDARRARVRGSDVLGGIDYVDVRPDGRSLCVHFFGALPRHLSAGHVVIEGGVRVRHIGVASARFHDHDDGDLCLLVTLDRRGDFSEYCVCLVEPEDGSVECSDHRPPPRARRVPEGIDPRYACAPFAFRVDCPSALDCAPGAAPRPPQEPPPDINYLARDFEGFRRVMLDRLAQTLPEWRERHLPDLGVTLVELFAYAADHLSYELDAVATEAFLRTARRRISVRRHARLVDYWMHEGCNARAWITIESDGDETLHADDLAFAVRRGTGAARGGGTIGWAELHGDAGATIFEPMRIGGSNRIEVVAAHSRIDFYTWERRECCLPAGATRATLLDGPGGDRPETPPRRLRLNVGDVLVLEETRGCATGAEADADPDHRHVVRLTAVSEAVDPLTLARICEIEWHPEDALPFDLHLRARTPAPECADMPAAVARGNVVLVDHGQTVEEENERWRVTLEDAGACCACDGDSYVQRHTPVSPRIELTRRPLTYAEPLPAPGSSAMALTARDPRQAVPAVMLLGVPGRPGPGRSARPEEWHPVRDLLASGPGDRHIAVEIDDDGIARIRFGDGTTGRAPAAGDAFTARLRVGSGPSGLAGRESIVWMARRSGPFSGIRLRPRNPLPAAGAEAPETTGEVKMNAPHAFGRVLERAVTAADYASLAMNDRRVQGAHGDLSWCGSWFEASTAIDVSSAYEPGEVAGDAVRRLERGRRIGHDLRIVAARQVPLDVAVAICVKPHHPRGHVERAARALLSAAVLPDGRRGLFHPDELSFGQDVAASKIIAALQALEGVAHVELTRFARLYAPAADAARTRDASLIDIAADEVPRLDGDPSAPEHGQLAIEIKGGR